MTELRSAARGNFRIFYDTMVIDVERREAVIFFWEDINPFFQRLACALLRHETEKETNDYWTFRPANAGERPQEHRDDFGQLGANMVESTFAIPSVKPSMSGGFCTGIYHPDVWVEKVARMVLRNWKRMALRVASGARSVLVRILSITL